MNNKWSTKDKASKQLKKALAALDTAVQKWYESNAPLNKECYATSHFRNYPDGSHVSEITLLPDNSADNYVDIPDDAYNKWRRAGELIQNAWPEGTPAEREVLISGLCDTYQIETFGEEVTNGKL